MIESTSKYGRVYLSPSCCTFGDYGGAATVGKSNVAVILEMAEENEWPVLSLTYCEWENVDKWEDEFTEQCVVDEFKSHHGPPVVVHLTGGWGSNTIWLLECPATADILAALADYPLLDDDHHSQVEMEEEDEAWESWVRADLESLLDDEHEYTEEQMLTAYRAAMEETNTYPVHETGGCWVDVSAIKDAFVKAIAA